jgi:hypothetical protein
MTPIRTAPLLVAIAAAFALAACGKKEEAPKPVVTPAPAPAPVVTAPPPVAPAGVTVASVTVGNAVDAAQNVSMTAKSLTPKDTIYAGVATTGAASNAVIVARWSFGDGQLVNEESRTIAPTGPAVTTFHIAKPDGWPVGKYKVDITLDGKPAGSQEFMVQ